MWVGVFFWTQCTYRFYVPTYTKQGYLGITKLCGEAVKIRKSFRWCLNVSLVSDYRITLGRVACRWTSNRECSLVKLRAHCKNSAQISIKLSACHSTLLSLHFHCEKISCHQIESTYLSGWFEWPTQKQWEWLVSVDTVAANIQRHKSKHRLIY